MRKHDEKCVKYVSCSGSPVHEVYAPKVNKDGTIDLVVSGYENTDEYIQSFEQSTDMSVILSRIANGETELLHKRTGSYGDFTKMPQTFAEALQLQIDSHRLFDSLPADIKQKFNGDANQFFAQSGTMDWFDKISPVLPDEVKNMIMPPKVEVSEEEVKE